MNLIIFEDRETTRQALIRLIDDFNGKIISGKEKINILLSSGDCREIINFAYDLKFPTAFMLDIEANGRNEGFEIAAAVRKLNPNHIILYVTKEQEEIIGNYKEKSNSIGFVLKRISASFIDEIYFYFMQSMEILSNDNFFTFSNRELALCKVPFKNIIMFEKIKSRDRSCLYYFSNGRVNITDFHCMSLGGLLSRLDSRFIHCYKSVIVNRDMISGISKKGLILKGELQCPYTKGRI